MKKTLRASAMVGFMILTGCSATHTQSQFACGALPPVRCEPLHVVDQRITQYDAPTLRVPRFGWVRAHDDRPLRPCQDGSPCLID